MGDGRGASGPTTVRRALTALLGVALALAGGTASAQRTIDVQPTGPRLYGDSWAVVIGINDY